MSGPAAGRGARGAALRAASSRAPSLVGAHRLGRGDETPGQGVVTEKDLDHHDKIHLGDPLAEVLGGGLGRRAAEKNISLSKAVDVAIQPSPLGATTMAVHSDLPPTRRPCAVDH